MKKIVVLIGSRNRKGNTANFSRKVLSNLSTNEYTIEYLFPQDFKIKPCLSCHQCFVKAFCVQKDELNLLQNKVLDSDVFVIASPVYLHYMTADLKMILERLSWWTHTMRLQGKPVVILSTCGNNGHYTVIKALEKIVSLMGGNIIAKSNAAQEPNQLYNDVWLKKVTTIINSRIVNFSQKPPQSNKNLEEIFISSISTIKKQELFQNNIKLKLGELTYWQDTGMLGYEKFSDYLKEKHNYSKEL